MAAGCVSSIAYIPSGRRSTVIEPSMLTSAARAFSVCMQRLGQPQQIRPVALDNLVRI
jgi:hypothetical protein